MSETTSALFSMVEKRIYQILLDGNVVYETQQQGEAQQYIEGLNNGLPFDVMKTIVRNSEKFKRNDITLATNRLKNQIKSDEVTFKQIEYAREYVGTKLRDPEHGQQYFRLSEMTDEEWKDFLDGCLAVYPHVVARYINSRIKNL